MNEEQDVKSLVKKNTSTMPQLANQNHLAQCPWIRRLNIIKILIHSKLTGRFTAIVTKIPVDFYLYI